MISVIRERIELIDPTHYQRNTLHNISKNCSSHVYPKSTTLHKCNDKPCTDDLAGQMDSRRMGSRSNLSI